MRKSTLLFAGAAIMLTTAIGCNKLPQKPILPVSRFGSVSLLDSSNMKLAKSMVNPKIMHTWHEIENKQFIFQSLLVETGYRDSLPSDMQDARSGIIFVQRGAYPQVFIRFSINGMMDCKYSVTQKDMHNSAVSINGKPVYRIYLLSKSQLFPYQRGQRPGAGSLMFDIKKLNINGKTIDSETVLVKYEDD